MRDCPSAKAVLVHGGLNNNLLEGRYGRCVDWLEDVARTLDLKAFSDFITVLWNIWNSRNNKVFQDVEEEARVTQLSFGLVARDHDGFVLGGRAGMVAQNVQAEWAEFHALVESFKFVRSRNWLKLEFETDCASLGRLVPPKSATHRRLGLAKALPAFEAARDPNTNSRAKRLWCALVSLFLPFPYQYIGWALCYPHRTVRPHSSSLTPLVLIEPKGCDRDPVLRT
ncbi:hypothetical protein GOBAR_AA32100 [Gossypium barbadense]|uniref:RNase H type-1 domain-containing protein n=1 Tax=Gossypium barbadense TaxID=3634 RepID=A0A2P5WBZ6_GOSBA|nr:hypothetical protein GOBAR_AA32100 [Gossypium barbadense]